MVLLLALERRAEFTSSCCCCLDEDEAGGVGCLGLLAVGAEGGGLVRLERREAMLGAADMKAARGWGSRATERLSCVGGSEAGAGLEVQGR